MASDNNNTMSTITIGAFFFAVTIQLLRLSLDLIFKASVASAKDYQEGGDGGKKEEKKKGKNGEEKEEEPLLKKKDSYGTLSTLEENSSTLTDSSSDSLEVEVVPSTLEVYFPLMSLVFEAVTLLYLFSFWMLMADKSNDAMMFKPETYMSCFFYMILGFFVHLSDYKRRRFYSIQRTLSLLGSFGIVFGCYCSIWISAGGVGGLLSLMTKIEKEGMYDQVLLAVMTLYLIVSITETYSIRDPSNMPQQHQQHQQHQQSSSSTTKKAKLSRHAILLILKPYFWPDATSTSNTATKNRIRAIMTWIFVILSKASNVISPILLGKASTALTHGEYGLCIRYSIWYNVFSFMSMAFKECQSLVYLKVAQAAFVQLSEWSFKHLHTLSLDWHLRKKLGEVIRSMDRGIAACDTLMKYLFLWLVPAIGECLAVCFIFATYFDYVPLGVSVFYFVFVYIVWTILLTLWRKKFRKAVVKHDNEWHDRCTDSLINFETVKYFTAEDYERQRFGESVKNFQSNSVNVQASLSFLNISQKLILQTCLAVSLSLSAYGIKKRMDCCIDNGCGETSSTNDFTDLSSLSKCCSNSGVCTGMEVGDFVAVLTYTIQLFQPLFFLGTVYNATVMAVIDLSNLSELLAESPDVVDAPDAMSLPLLQDDDVPAVEFDNVHFHYPTQSSQKGLKGLSFVMKRGTTTAIVGPTGAGKTTVSRLFFRFYDVLEGAVKVNGVDVRTVTQKSLRRAIGVVPQSTSMFNDTLRSNVLYGKRDATDEELDQAARDAQLMDFINTLEDGWETVVGDRGLKLSGGEKQRTAIARCLLKDPPFVVLDEATSALDTITENSVQEALDRLGSERTVLVIAHRLGTIRNADNIVVVKDGVVAEQGTHDDLLELEGGIYKDMWNMQLHSNSRRGSSAALDQMDS